MDELKTQVRQCHVEIADQLRILDGVIEMLPTLISDLKGEAPIVSTKKEPSSAPPMEPFADVWNNLATRLENMQNKIVDHVAQLRELLF